MSRSGSSRSLIGLLVAVLLACPLGCKREEQRGALQYEATSHPLAASPLTLPGLLGRPFQLVKEGGAQTLPPGEQLLLKGFGLTVREVLQEKAGESIAITLSGHRVRQRDLEPPVISPFEGDDLVDGRLRLAWVIRSRAPVLRDPDPRARVVARRARLGRVTLVSRGGPSGYYQTQGGWMSESDLAIPTLAARPAEVGPAELWLDLDLRSQTLVAYRGDQPFFATLVSAGTGAPGTAFATPVGNHRITGKRLMTQMSNLDHRGVPAYYFYEEVPLAQFIGRVALHGVYWHDGFGQPRSHGCINLSLRDALRLFQLTKPDLPAGAEEIAAEGRSGTLIRVHREP